MKHRRKTRAQIYCLSAHATEVDPLRLGCRALSHDCRTLSSDCRASRSLSREVGSRHVTSRHAVLQLLPNITGGGVPPPPPSLHHASRRRRRRRRRRRPVPQSPSSRDCRRSAGRAGAAPRGRTATRPRPASLMAPQPPPTGPWSAAAGPRARAAGSRGGWRRRWAAAALEPAAAGRTAASACAARSSEVPDRGGCGVKQRPKWGGHSKQWGLSDITGTHRVSGSTKQ